MGQVEEWDEKGSQRSFHLVSHHTLVREDDEWFVAVALVQPPLGF